MASYDDLDALLTALVDAAIDADMWERGFKSQSGDRYEDLMTWRTVYRGDPGRNDLEDSSDTTDYEAEVFTVWPGVIEQIFAAWKADVIPDPADFQSQIDALRDCADPIGLPSMIAPVEELRGAVPPPGGGGMSGLVSDLSAATGPLRGRWVDAFQREYVAPLPYVLGNQAALLELLASCVETEQEIWLQTRQSVADLAEAGAGWFRSIMDGGNVWELVVEVGKAMYTVFELRRASNPVEAGKEILGLIESGVEIKALIDSNAPADPRETGVPGTVDGIKTKIAQTLEYTINDQIIHTEERLQLLLDDVVKSVERNPATFAMGDSHLARVADASHVLSPEQVISEREVQQAVRSLFRLGDEVTAAASGIVTSVYPFVRPGSIGIGSSGPYDSVIAVENVIHHAMHDTAFALERAGTAVRIAADYAFAADAGNHETLCRVNERLETAQLGFEDSIRPPGRGVSPYTEPDASVHVEVPPCDVPEDPFLGGEEPEWHAPMAPPQTVS